MDSTGLGMQFAERAQEKYGAYKVEAVRFTNAVKEELAYPVRAAFEDKAIRIPYDDKIRADLRAIKKTTTGAGNLRFDSDRSEDGHSDRFWALALAIHAAGAGGPMAAWGGSDPERMPRITDIEGPDDTGDRNIPQRSERFYDNARHLMRRMRANVA
jgi:phage FluMu gp28-like protein